MLQKDALNILDQIKLDMQNNETIAKNSDLKKIILKISIKKGLIFEQHHMYYTINLETV